MSDPDNEVERLRASDPVTPSSLPSADSAAARELFERITMTDTTASTPLRRYAILAVAASVMVALGAVALARQDSDAPRQVSSATSTTLAAGGPLSPGGGMTGSCVEMYSLANLAHREVAFDGVVEAVEGDTITFRVNRWYRGGSGTTTTRQGAATLGGMTSAGAGTPLTPGSRLLVAGDGEFAWSCGFTQAYDAEVAAQWATAFAAG
ncbi:MAG: hypothetical protein Q8K63_06160 [Acidimicrobiales bacterium]|nr:hypothetical protein [Acidimicrobiales bacterium]